MFSSLMKLLFPPKCIICGKLMHEENVFSVCNNCFPKLEFNNGKRCGICATPLEILYGEERCANCRHTKRWFEKAFVPFVYKENIRAAIIRYKFFEKKSYAKPLASFIFTDIKSYGGTDDADIVTFVPLHFKRLGERGYNQAELLAKSLAVFLGKPLVKTLKKALYLEPLSRTKHSKRSEVLKGSFEVIADVKGKNILLVDDVITTGSTVNECAKMLIKAGAKKVYAAAAAATKR